MRKSRLVHLLLCILSILLLFAQPGEAASSAAPPSQDGPPAGLDAFPGRPVDQLIVKYKEGGARGRPVLPDSAAQVARMRQAAGVDLSYRRAMSGGAHVYRLPQSAAPEAAVQLAARLAALPEVEYAEPDYIMTIAATPNDPSYGSQWHYFTPSAGNYGINLPPAWDITTGSASVVAAVIDTGITAHADLSGRTVPGYDFITNSTAANDGSGRDADPSDPGDWIVASECFPGSAASPSSWHGTHVAGTIGAKSNNSLGVAGINWNSKILPVRVLGKCGGVPSDIADGMRWAAGLSVPGVPANANPAKVLNLSLGGPGACISTYQSAVNDVVAAGATVVVAAGNSGQDASTFQPANCSGVITVAATNRNGSKAGYSNDGAMVEISAPGGVASGKTDPNGVLSTLNTGVQGPVADSYAYYQGTSMAAPHVAGVVSLLYSLNPSITPAQVLLALQSTATAFPGGSTCSTANCGSGIVNAAAALQDDWETLYLPALSYSKSYMGKVTYKGAPASGMTITLRYWDGSSYSTWTETATNSSGNYNITNLPPVGSGKDYYVRWINTAGTHSYLAGWICDDVTGAPADEYECSFDLQDVALSLPANNASVSLPYTFKWVPRISTGDVYEVEWEKDSTYIETSGPLPYSSAFTLSGIPSWFPVPGWYNWSLNVYGPNGWGLAHYFRQVQILNHGSMALFSEDGSILLSDEISPISPHKDTDAPLVPLPAP